MKMNKYIFLALLITNSSLVFGSTVYHKCGNIDGTIKGDPKSGLYYATKSYKFADKASGEPVYTESIDEIPEKNIIDIKVVAELEKLESSLGQSVVYAAKIRYINQYSQERSDFLICEDVAISSPF